MGDMTAQPSPNIRVLTEMEEALQDKVKLYEIFRQGMSSGNFAFKIVREEFSPVEIATWPLPERCLDFLRKFPREIQAGIGQMRDLADRSVGWGAGMRESLLLEESRAGDLLNRMAAVQKGFQAEAVEWFSNPSREVAYGTNLMDERTWTQEEQAKRAALIEKGSGTMNATGAVIETAVKPRLEKVISALPKEEQVMIERFHRRRLLDSMEVIMDLPAAKALQAAKESIIFFEEGLALRATPEANESTIHSTVDGKFMVGHDDRELIPMDDENTSRLRLLQANREECRILAEAERRVALNAFNTDMAKGKYDVFLPFTRSEYLPRTPAISLAALPAMQPEALSAHTTLPEPASLPLNARHPGRAGSTRTPGEGRAGR